ncbi:SCP2 sterol-binding domain-containing protein [Kosmotoga pacifica]|uniref:SCP2 domain-containing protein n=1 Tax=Kosmotoga pacifica TaxID=1330330 RepID=A0A0G2Z6T5_9BACT|nr:SCP2 sterol-binding domain-containing protein [Kosmotoga pacifica]AKI97272.1 hypothetical protein IX53_04965 [Kosmotoga pacifica]
MTAEKIARIIKEHFDEISVGDFSGTFQIIVHGETSEAFSFIFSEGKMEFAKGKIDNPDCTIETDEATFQALLEGTKRPMAAFMTGKLKVTGNLDLALKFGQMLG